MKGIAMKQVLDIEQMRRLQELGLELKETLLSWCVKGNWITELFPTWLVNKNSWELTISAYTLQEVLDLLPKQIGVEYIYDLCIFPGSISYTQFIGGEINDNLFEVPIDGNLIDSAYSLLCWCVENGYIETNKIVNEL